MRTIFFIKKGQVVGAVTLDAGINLTPEHVAKIKAKGFDVMLCAAPTAAHDGHVNEYVDKLLETGKLGGIAPVEAVQSKFIMNDKGRFLIEVDGKRSHSVSYQSIVTLQTGNKLYAGVSAYYEGSLPHETVFEVTEVPDCKNVLENFVEQPIQIKTKK